MMKIKKYKYIITLFILFLSNSLLYSNQKEKAQENRPIKILGDRIESFTKEDLINVKGNAKVFYGSTTIDSDTIEYNRKTKEVKAIGNVLLLEDKDKVTGDSVLYRLNTKQGEIEDPTFYSPPWILRGKKSKKIDEDTFVLKNGYFTSCDHDPPHFKFKATKIVVHLKKSLWAYNVFLLIRGIPSLYLPVVYQSLRKFKPEIELASGRNSTEGEFYKFRFMYPFSEDDRLTTYIDKFQYQGLGFGLKYEYNRQDKLRGSLYGYYIEDQKTSKRLFRTDNSHWHRLNKNFTTSLRFNYKTLEAFGSEPELFNDDDINRDINSYLAFNYSKDKISVNVAWDRTDKWEGAASTDTKGSFIKQAEKLPSFSFGISRSPVIDKILYYSYGLSLVNTYAKVKNEYYGSGSTNISFASGFRLSRTFNITPQCSLYGNWDNAITLGNFNETFSNRYATSLNARKRIARWGTLDITHSFGQYLYKQNYNNQDITHNAISSNLVVRPSRKFRTSIGTSYDLNLVTDDNLKRLRPIDSIITYKPTSKLDLYFRDAYDAVNGKTNLLQSHVTVKDGSFKLNQGATFLGNDPNHLDLTGSLYFNLNNKWRIENHLRYKYDMREAIFDSNSSYFREQKYSIIRNLHCWEVKFLWKKTEKSIGMDEETWILFNIKAIPGQQIGVYHSSKYENTSDWQIKSGE